MVVRSGSLLDASVRAALEELLLGGHVAALHAGPLCGPFSTLRRRPLPHGPRPLCNRDSFWTVLPGATVSERMGHVRSFLPFAQCRKTVSWRKAGALVLP